MIPEQNVAIWRRYATSTYKTRESGHVESGLCQVPERVRLSRGCVRASPPSESPARAYSACVSAPAKPRMSIEADFLALKIARDSVERRFAIGGINRPGLMGVPDVMPYRSATFVSALPKYGTPARDRLES